MHSPYASVMSSFWIMEQTDSERSPHLITIYQNQKRNLQLLTQDAWPAEGKGLFGLRSERDKMRKQGKVTCRGAGWVLSDM
ncbi:MAG: hypothetical protein ACOC0U_07255 [Desulfovibrionales bacterium]